MTLIGNLIWIAFGGLSSSLSYIVGGALICLTLIGIPFGVQSIRIGVATFAPFGTEVVESENGKKPLQRVFDLLWLLLFGWLIALMHVLSALLLAITIVGLPFAKQHLKLVPIALFPFGRELARSSEG